MRLSKQERLLTFPDTPYQGSDRAPPHLMAVFFYSLCGWKVKRQGHPHALEKAELKDEAESQWHFRLGLFP